MLLVMVVANASANETVTTMNFIRAETDMQMQGYVDTYKCFSQFHHNRAMYDVTKQITIRPNTDTLYSFGVFDLTEDLSLRMPKTDRYQSAMVVNQNHSLFALYEGEYVLTQDKMRTRYIFIILRTFVDPNDPADLEKAHEIQDMVKVSQKKPGTFAVPEWDKETLETKRKELVEIASLLPNSRGMFGDKEKLNPVMHLLGAAYGWGGLPEADASYDMASPTENDGKTVHTLTVKDVPVDGFWSVTVYNKDGYFDINDRGIYSLNSKTVKRNADGSATVQFGECKGVDNCLDIMDGWNYAIRMYRPQKSILDGTWRFPAPVKK
jgi:hypothetical protein